MFNLCNTLFPSVKMIAFIELRRDLSPVAQLKQLEKKLVFLLF